MFGLSWGQIAIIVLVGVFVLGPERIPTAVTWVMSSLRKVRTMAAGAQAELRREIGPELEELRRQVADLQSLKELQELRDLRDLHPKRLIGKNILGDEFSGGITGFLGLGPTPATADAGSARQSNGQAAANGAMQDAGAGVDFTGPGAADPGAGDRAAVAQPGAPVVTRSPSMTKLAAPKLVGSTAPLTPSNPLEAGERPPFDPDAT